MRQSLPPSFVVTADDVEPVDLDGLMCALVLVPGSYSRNRNFGMYQDAERRAVLRRSRLVRALVRELLRPEEKTISFEPREGGVTLALEIPAVQLRRRALLSPIEHDLVEYLLARSRGARAEEPARRVEQALARLSLPVAPEPPPAAGLTAGRAGLSTAGRTKCSGASGS
ncbi:MAG: hypothetical protein JNK04_08385 [Myxococcales bacterium]|nr:hypothetical protein [Myxococcales bacterium]